MPKKNEIYIKVVITTLLFLILILSLLNHSNFCEINKNKVVNKISFANDRKIANRIKFNNEVLYVSRHDGTISNFSNIAERLSLNVTVFEPSYDFEERPHCYEKDKCKSFVELMCSNFDYIVISDIIPDSYIYFTNECKAKVILEITNRFNIFVLPENEEDYYKKFAKAVVENKNLVVVENNPYEVYHACLYQIFVPNYYLIRPVGYAPPEVLEKEYKETHDEIAIIKHSNQDKEIAIPKLEEIGVKFKKLNGRYGGPLVLATYKAVIMFPYQVSIMKMMENFRYGVAMIVPSERLFEELCRRDDYDFSEKKLLDTPGGITNYIEFYNKEFRDLFVYFDQWEDLPEIIENTDFDSLKIKVKNYIVNYEKKALDLWAQAFGILPPKGITKDKKPLCDETVFYNYDKI